LLGIIALILSTLFATGKDLVSKKVSNEISATVSACTSFIFALPWYLIFLLILYLFDENTFKYSGFFLTFVFLRAITDSFAELFKMYALQNGEISFIANFFSLTPIFLVFLAPFITGDKITELGLLGLLIIVSSSLFLLTSPKEVIPWKGIIYALSSAFFFSLNICLDRLAVQHAGPVFSGFMMTLFSGFFLLLPMLRTRNWKPQCTSNYKFLTLRGLFEVIFMSLKLLGLQYIEPQYASGIQKLTLVFSVSIGGKAFHEKEQGKRILISLFIILGSFLIIYSKYSN